jgi:hypothetical protein
MTSVVNHTQNEDIVLPLHVEDAVGKALKIGAADFLVNQGVACRIGPNLDQQPIQVIPEREIETWSLKGIPLLRFQDVPLRDGTEPGSNHR